MIDIEKLKTAHHVFRNWVLDKKTTIHAGTSYPIDAALGEYITLLEDHPGIQGLIDGTHWIAPNETPPDMTKEEWFYIQTRISYRNAMRKASEK